MGGNGEFAKLDLKYTGRWGIIYNGYVSYIENSVSEMNLGVNCFNRGGFVTVYCIVISLKLGPLPALEKLLCCQNYKLRSC